MSRLRPTSVEFDHIPLLWSTRVAPPILTKFRNQKSSGVTSFAMRSTGCGHCKFAVELKSACFATVSARRGAS